MHTTFTTMKSMKWRNKQSISKMFSGSKPHFGLKTFYRTHISITIKAYNTNECFTVSLQKPTNSMDIDGSYPPHPSCIASIPTATAVAMLVPLAPERPGPVEAVASRTQRVKVPLQQPRTVALRKARQRPRRDPGEPGAPGCWVYTAMITMATMVTSP